ncbi:hypothetical protein POM88_016873 [Heracleum sosnowskyi]|uniref:Uncharacterized protein n=1 Tax=Heracleum sosnowskyi TaxID=360622 RepID=A0AAD8MTE1_9APIA|nr:hypothetical protein POM88_016873 [Heracleum sosnowskyi]
MILGVSKSKVSNVVFNLVNEEGSNTILDDVGAIRSDANKDFDICGAREEFCSFRYIATLTWKTWSKFLSICDVCFPSQRMRHFYKSFTRRSKLINALSNQNCQGLTFLLLIMLVPSPPQPAETPKAQINLPNSHL